jgi:ribonuclease HI
MINSMTAWIRRWKANGWKATNGRRIANRLELEELDDASRKINVRYVSSFHRLSFW